MKLLIILFTLIGSLILMNVFDEPGDPVLNEPNKSAINNNDFAIVIYHYVDDFNSPEKEKIENWLNQVAEATQSILGTYPFELHFYLHRSDNSTEPVPWANTVRSEIQGVHFHVNTDYSLDEFLSDWTAPHEISHLAIPFVGKSNAWFSEGFATYMQNEILLEMKECTQEDIDKKFKTKLDMARPYYQENEPFDKVAMSLRKTYNYPEMYWGGAYFFIQLNASLLASNDRSLGNVLKEYQSCCRLEDGSMGAIIESIDKLVEGEPARDLLSDFQTLAAKDVFK